MNRILQRAFTLIEVNLAIFIMAGGVLAMISLYSFGFRESRQSREDVAAAALAEQVLNPLVVALSSRNMTWTQWRNLGFGTVSAGSGTSSTGARVQVLPAGGSRSGWLAYVETRGSGEDTKCFVPTDPENKARGVYNALIGANADGWSLPGSVSTPEGMTYALVASRESANSPVISLAVRCVRRNLRNTLMAQPVFATEVHFQGDPSK